MISAIVMFSGGVGSWAAARRAVDRYGVDAVRLLFTDTLIEDADLYRFLVDAAADIGAELVRVADGRTPWDVFRDRRMLGNSRVAPCSAELKQAPARRWMSENADADSAVVVLGIDWTEEHRLAGAVRGWSPWGVWAPLCEPPFRTKAQLLLDLDAAGISRPALYREGFPHNNCGGGCVRAGQAQFAHLLRARPNVYAEWEDEEEKMRRFLDRDISILRDRRNGKTAPLTLRELRIRTMYQPELIDGYDWGGCGCFIDTVNETEGDDHES